MTSRSSTAPNPSLLRQSLLLLLLFGFVGAGDRPGSDRDLGGGGLRLVPPPSAGRRSNATRMPGVAKNASRQAFKKDVMVVLPVMQGNSDLSSSNLQILYTKAPVTAIIGDDRSTQPKLEDEVGPTVAERIDSVAATAAAGPAFAHFSGRSTPSTARLSHKSHKSPLDYGYPESFKFVQELNELPKNHKPEWAQTETQERDVDVGSTQTPDAIATKGDPFQMFESVKPLEINKLLSSKVATAAPSALSPPATENDVFEEAPPSPVTTTTPPPPTKKKFQQSSGAESPHRFSKRPITKRPPLLSSSKKPPKNKIAQPAKVIDNNDVDDDDRRPETVSTASSVELDPELYAAARYSTLLAETTKAFLPTPYMASGERSSTVLKRPQAGLPTAATTKSTVDGFPLTSLAPNLQWSNASSEHSSNNTSSGQIKPLDLASLNKILGEDLNAPLPPLPSPHPVQVFTPPAADALTGDVKNMLIALGIIESEQGPTTTPTTSAATSASDSFLQNLFAKPQRTQQPSAAPTIDPNSYANFKKIPIDFEKQKDDRAAVSDDMRHLLASFGLLPGGKSGHTRVSRQRGSRWPRRQNSTVDALGNETGSWPPEMRNALENLDLSEASALTYQRSATSKSGHVFQPTIRLEEFGGDEHKAKKINDAIETIRNLSKIEDVENLSAEEVQKKLETITSLLNDFNDTGNASTSDTANTTVASIPSTTSDAPSSATTTLSTSETVSSTTSTSTTTTLSTTKTVSSTASTSTTTTLSTTEAVSSTASTATTESEVFLIDNDSIPELTTNSVHSTSANRSSADEFQSESVISPTKLSNSTENELKLTMNPPNPLSPDELQHLLEFNHNDVQKRQQPNDTTTTMSSSSTPSKSDADDEASSSPTTIAATVQANNAPLPDLEASFGGADDESSANSDETSTPKPNGLYFYLDWNTFLNVGEQDKTPIRIRFAPRAGNPRNFLPITVP